MRIIAFNGGECRTRCAVSIRRIRGYGGVYYPGPAGGVTSFDYELVGGVGTIIDGSITYTQGTGAWEFVPPIPQLTVGQLLPVDGSLPWGNPSSDFAYRWVRDREYRGRSLSGRSYSSTGGAGTTYRRRTSGDRT
jgi:hypothetical protein